MAPQTMHKHSRSSVSASSVPGSPLFDSAEHDSGPSSAPAVLAPDPAGSASELDDIPADISRPRKQLASHSVPRLHIEGSPEPETIVSRVHRLSLDEDGVDTDAERSAKSMRFGGIQAPNAPRIGAISTPPMAMTPNPSTPRPAGRRPGPDMRLDLNGLSGFGLARTLSSSSGGSSSSPVSPSRSLRLPPLRPALVSRFSSDDMSSRPSSQPSTPGLPVTPGTHDALFAFGIPSTVGSPYSSPRTPDTNLWGGSPLASPVTEVAPAFMARTRSLGRSGLSESITATSPKQTSPPALLGHADANALYHTLLPGAPRNVTSPPSPLERARKSALVPGAYSYFTPHA